MQHVAVASVVGVANGVRWERRLSSVEIAAGRRAPHALRARKRARRAAFRCVSDDGKRDHKRTTCAKQSDISGSFATLMSDFVALYTQSDSNRYLCSSQ